MKPRRKTISWEVFSGIAILLLVGVILMGSVQTALSYAYFSKERRAALTNILDSATILTERLAKQGSVVTNPVLNEEVRELALGSYELFQTSSGATVFVAASDGSVLLTTGPDDEDNTKVPPDLIAEMDRGEDVFVKGDFFGLYDAQYYTLGRQICVGSNVGYLFASTPMDALGSYVTDTFSIFVLSAGLMVLFSSLISVALSRHITKPIEDISTAARALGSGDFTARAPVDGCEELAEFATTFNNMAGRLQTIDNARGQFMGNIAHELRTPMTSIKGFIDGMLDGTIPESEYKHYLGVVKKTSMSHLWR